MTDEKEWRRFMDQKWAEYYRDRDLFNKRYSSDALRPTPNLLSEVANKKKDTQPAQKKSQAPRSTNQKPMAKANSNNNLQKQIAKANCKSKLQKKWVINLSKSSPTLCII